MECDAMSIDVTFEELEKTAFEFAKSLAVNNVQAGYSLQAMNRAKIWHAEAPLRKSWYIRETIEENDWVNINIDSDYDESDFKENIGYWVVRGEEKPFKAVLNKFVQQGERTQPVFSLPDNPYQHFAINCYLPQSIGDQLVKGIEPKHPSQDENTTRPMLSKLRVSY